MNELEELAKAIEAVPPVVDMMHSYEVVMEDSGYIDGVVMPHGPNETPGRLWGDPAQIITIPDSWFPFDPGVPGERFPERIVPESLRFIE